VTVELVVIGGSWGGFDAVCALLAPLPHDTHVPFVVALHRSSRSQDDALEHMLSNCVSLDVVPVEDKAPLKAGCVHVAPADYHLLIENGSLALSTDELVRFSRPSIDVLFDSAADEYAAGAVGIVLSGANADGAAGVRRLKAAGGVTMAQDPETATKPAMPQAAIDTGDVDFVGSVPELAHRLRELIAGNGP
jgi:two-component system chemotaxis response regulator CheB